MMTEQAEKAMLARMRRIEGQARGVQRMITEHRDCLEILNQLASLRSAAYSASVELTEQYAMQCVREAAGSGTQDEALVSEAMRGLVDVLLRTPHWWIAGGVPQGRCEMEILGLSSDAVVTVLMLVGWIVLMRFVLPRMGVSTWMGQACDAASPREENEVRAELEGEGEIGAE